jgi:hypothetical protein
LQPDFLARTYLKKREIGLFEGFRYLNTSKVASAVKRPPRAGLTEWSASSENKPIVAIDNVAALRRHAPPVHG